VTFAFGTSESAAATVRDGNKHAFFPRVTCYALVSPFVSPRAPPNPSTFASGITGTFILHRRDTLAPTREREVIRSLARMLDDAGRE